MSSYNGKVYILTFQHVLNNGGLLQAYGLSCFLKGEGVDVEILNYKPWYFMLQTYRPAKGVLKTLTKFKKVLSFQRFRKNLPITKTSYYSVKSLRKLDTADFIICGSDQIWNANLTGGKPDPVFYINFAKPLVKKIAYAASSGNTPVKSNWGIVGPWLKSFDSTGVREQSICDDLNVLAPNLTPRVVVDPSLLISDYEDIANYSRVPEGDFLLTYIVGSGENLELFDNFVKSAKAMYGLPVVHIGAKNITSSDTNVEAVGPDEWVAFFKSAKNVITNSFHGTAFSINFEKQFIFYPNINDLLNERQVTLLKGVGLLGRKISELNANNLPLIDYDVITPRLQRMRNESSSFLLDSLK